VWEYFVAPTSVNCLTLLSLEIYCFKMEEAYERLIEQCKVSVNGQCLLYDGSTNEGGYGRIGQNMGDKWVPVYCHRLSYMKNHPDEHITGNISHLCHNKVCVLPEHLSHEPGWVNQRRRYCVNKGHCIGHEYPNGNYPDCLLHLKIWYLSISLPSSIIIIIRIGLVYG
jgi:hypothetical protein